MTKTPTAFISYSWDNQEHQDWVTFLANQLRQNGIDTTMDIFEIQDKTVNLNQMMVTEIRESDYILLVITESYTLKADAFQGGVGFETNLLFHVIRENLDKVILIVRQTGINKKVIPFYLQGVYFEIFQKKKNSKIKLKN